MAKKSVRDVDVQGKTVLVRVDFNVPLEKGTGRVTDVTRLRASLPTIEYLCERDARVVLMSHLGRPDGQVKPELSLAPVARELAGLLGTDVKLASDCIVRAGEIRARRPHDVCPPPESWDGGALPSGDVWSLGSTIVQALTKHPPEQAKSSRGEDSDPIVPRNLPEPFFDIVRNCLRRDPQSRWTLAQIASRLHGPRLPEIAAPQIAAAQEAPGRNVARSRAALVAVGACVLIGGAIFLGTRERSQPGVSTPAPATISQRVEAAAPATLPPAPVAPPRSEPAGKNDNWFVVVATYSQKKDAEKRALSMRKRFPQFKTEAYAPGSQNGQPYYFVVAGSNLAQKAAATLQDRVRSSGMARDAYITRF